MRWTTCCVARSADHNIARQFSNNDKPTGKQSEYCDHQSVREQSHSAGFSAFEQAIPAVKWKTLLSNSIVFVEVRVPIPSMWQQAEYNNAHVRLAALHLHVLGVHRAALEVPGALVSERILVALSAIALVAAQSECTQVLRRALQEKRRRTSFT